MNYVSFSLYGSNSKYLIGAIRNAEQIKKFYPDFTALFYVGSDIAKSWIDALVDRGARISYIRTDRIKNPKMFRFFAVEKPNADVVLVRDTDSRFTERETRAVEQWLKSPQLFHCMRDYPAHDMPIMGGLWGWKRGLKLNIFSEAADWSRQLHNKGKTSDQGFLAEKIWPKVQHTVMQHDSFFRHKYAGSIPFPDGDRTPDGSFVGEVIDEHERPQQLCRDARFVGKRGEDLL